MGIVSSNISGAPFNGGTLTGPLTIDTSPDAVTVPLHVRAGDPSTVGVDVVVDPASSSLTVKGLDNAGSLVVTDDGVQGTSTLASTGLAVTATGGSIYRQDANFANAIQLRADGLFIAIHAAPADASLNAGDCVLWFDQTNGAAKLMVKAKQADGAVKTASIALA